MSDNNCCLCYMHRSKSFAIIIWPHPNLAYHIHGPSKSTLAIWSVKMQVRQNPPLRFGPPKSSPSNSGLWSFLVLQNPVLQIQSPLHSSQNREKNTLKHPILGVQGYSRSSMLIKIKSWLPVLVDKQHVYVYHSATVFTLNEPIPIKWSLTKKVPLFDTRTHRSP